MQDTPQVQAIRARYKASFPEKAKMIINCISLIDDKSVVESDFLEIKEHLHKLAGSSGMYGYQDVCDVARSSMVSAESGDSASVLSGLQQLRDLLLGYA